MTEHDPTSRPRRSRGTKILACYVWFCALAVAALEVSLLSPIVPRSHSSRMDTIDFYLSGAMFQMLWLWSLLSERLDRYDRRKVRFFRRMGLLTQGCFLTLLTLGVWHTPHRSNAAVATFFLLLAMLMWRALAATTALHPNDQKVMDAVIEEEEQLQAQHRQAEIMRLREESLRDALSQVRRFTTVTPEPGPADTKPNDAIAWSIPRGKHEPLVYFLRNGNRIKIGTTTELRRRIRTLALRPEHVALLLAGDQRTERELHRQFAALRDGNTEWFQDAGPLAQYVADHIARLAPQEGK